MTKRVPRASTVNGSASRARTRPRRRGLSRNLKTVLTVLFLLVESVVAVALVSSAAIFWKFSSDLPSVESLADDVHAPVATTIWSEDGVLLGKLQTENRQPVALDEMSKHVLNGTVAIEDHRFYEHPGVDVQSILRAIVANAGGNRMRQGASTLTQQLVRNLDQFGLSREKTLSRKLREILIALRVEQVYSKQDILKLYLNNVYYGAGAYGIQAASKTYFGKSAYKLDLAEAALLAGLPQRPSEFSPFLHLHAALGRRNDVLDRMRSYGYITDAEYEKAIAETPRLMSRPERKNFDFKAPYFVTYVLKDLMRTDRYGAEFVYSGLRIETTLNWKMQQYAEHALNQGLANAAGQGANQGALICLDNHTGYIRAMVGGRNFHADQFNAVTQGKRQPGSAFKLFDYTAAFDTGTTDLESGYTDKPIPYPHDPEGRVVKNYDGGYSYKYITCKEAIMFSKNTIAVQVAQDVGIKRVIEYAHRMGITSKLAPYLPTALGASAVRPLDLCSAYSVLPTNGNRCVPMSLVRLSDADSNLIEEHIPQIKPVHLKDKTFAQMNEALEAVVTGGTGTLARGDESTGIVENAHGKTGTTSDSRDAWFAGYTPELSTVIWVASVHRSRHGPLRYEAMPGATGGHLCAPIWHDFMIKAVPLQRKFKLMQQVDVQPEPTTPAEPAAEAPRPKHAVVPKVVHTRLAVNAGNRAPDTAAVSNAPPTEEPTTAESPDGAPTSTSLTAAPSPDVRVATPPVKVHETTVRSLAPPAMQEPGSHPPAVTPVREAVRDPIGPTHSASTNVVSTPSARLQAPEMVTVQICVDSGERATKWCDSTKSIRVTAARAARMRRCHLHHAPPGEPG